MDYKVDKEEDGGKAPVQVQAPGPEILPIKPMESEGEAREIHYNLPNVNTGSLIVLVGPVKSGKGTLWNNLLHNDSMYGDDFFDMVTIMSNTIKHDQTSRFSYEKWKDSCYSFYSDAVMEALIEIQEAKLKIKEADTSYAIIIDDMHGGFSKNSGGKERRAFPNFCTRFRHFARRGKDPCMVLVSTQRIMDLDCAVRTCATNVCLSSGIKSAKELDRIMDIWADSYGGKKSFLNLWKQVQDNGPYSWLHLYLDRTPCEAYINFSTRIY